MRFFISAIAAVCLVSACGGNAPEAPVVALQSKTSGNAVALTDVTLEGARDAFTIARTDTGYRVTNLATGAVADYSNVRRFNFTDTTLAFDLEGTAGQGFRLYQAAFNRTPDLDGLGFWVNAIDKGIAVGDVASAFVASPEFKAAYGNTPSNAEIVNRYYENVLHRTPDSSGTAFWIGVLESKAASVADVLLGFTDSAENKAGVAASIANGITFTSPAAVAQFGNANLVRYKAYSEKGTTSPLGSTIVRAIGEAKAQLVVAGLFGATLSGFDAGGNASAIEGQFQQLRSFHGNFLQVCGALVSPGLGSSFVMVNSNATEVSIAELAGKSFTFYESCSDSGERMTFNIDGSASYSEPGAPLTIVSAADMRQVFSAAGKPEDDGERYYFKAYKLTVGQGARYAIVDIGRRTVHGLEFGNASLAIEVTN